MKAIKDCEWFVTVVADLTVKVKYGKLIYWSASTAEGEDRVTDGDYMDLCIGKLFPSIKKAKENWIEFAKLNNITNYKFI